MNKPSGHAGFTVSSRLEPLIDLSGAIRRSTISEAVAHRLRSEIQRGQLPPGAYLRQEDVAYRLGVSTTPVREAFQILRGEGRLTVGRNRGAIVFQPTVDDLRELTEIREPLERLAITLVIENRPDRDSLQQLGRMIREMEDSRDDGEWMGLNERFHAGVYELAGRPRLCSIISRLANATSGYMRTRVDRERQSGEADREHRAILSTLYKGDIEGAQQAVRTHIYRAIERALSGHMETQMPRQGLAHDWAGPSVQRSR